MTSPSDPSQYHDEAFVTLKEASAWLRVREERVREWIREGKLKAFRTGGMKGRFLIRCKWVREFVEKMASNPAG